MKESNKIEKYYLDDDGNIVDPEKATRGVIRELDENGNLVNETWGTFSKEPEMSNEELGEYIAELLKKDKEFSKR